MSYPESDQNGHPPEPVDPTEWLEVEGHFAVPLPSLLYPTVERWVPLICEIVHRGDDEEYIARCLQAIVDDEVNAAFARLERSLVKETR